MNKEAISKVIDQSVIDNGRVYFDPKYKSTVFNGISIGGRRKQEDGERDLGTIVVISGVLSNGSAITYDKDHHDVRLSGPEGKWLSPRASIRRWLIDLNAAPGDYVRLIRTSETTFDISLIKTKLT